MTREAQTTAIVEYDPIERTLQEFRGKYGARQFDVSTPDGFVEAKSVAREGRKALTELEKIRKRIKQPAWDRCKQIDADAKRLAAGIGAIFDPLFRQVDEEERRQEQERKEAERKEAQRVAGIRERMERLDPQIPFGATAAEIVGLLNYVRATPVDDSFAEFEDDAYFVRVASIGRLEDALAKVQAQEAAEAASAEALRLEREESARLRAQVEAQERAASAAAAAAAAPPAGQLFPVEPSPAADGALPTAFCRSCLRPLPPAATDCDCGWSMLPAQDDAGRPPLSAPGGLKERIAAFDPPRPVDDLAGRLIRQAERNVAAADGPTAPPADPNPPKRPAPVTADFFDDRANDRVRICGVTYNGDFFRAMRDAPDGGWFRIIVRDGSCVGVFQAPAECDADFDEAAGVPDPEGWSE